MSDESDDSWQEEFPPRSYGDDDDNEGVDVNTVDFPLPKKSIIASSKLDFSVAEDNNNSPIGQKSITINDDAIVQDIAARPSDGQFHDDHQLEFDPVADPHAPVHAETAPGVDPIQAHMLDEMSSPSQRRSRRHSQRIDAADAYDA